MLTENKIYLASKSPRRRELLHQINIQFDLILLRDAAPRGPDVSEIVLPDELPEAYVSRVTQEKADMAWNIMQMRKLPARPILSADTSVIIDQQILGKPADHQQAMHMLSLLTGRTHQVLTSLAVRHADGLHTITQKSEVTFDRLDQAQMKAYCDSSEPYDKAGGYGIQGAAARFISHISGSYSGIMGLPLFETCQLLRQAGIFIP
ncbi:Maf family protein [Undibacterium sp. SXout7W]|uniref:Maf family protein n=1 Tax=Undibacterium sp. SXout7W TaxID=3413049 RepID=UPI003BF38D08